MKLVMVRDAIARGFRRLDARERRLVALAAIVVCAAAAWTLIDWAMTQRTQLARRLPEARAQLLQMQAQAEELARLQQTSPPAAVGLPGRAEAARAAARARQLDLTIDTAGSGLVISGQAPADAFLDWLASMHGEQRLRVAKLNLEPTARGIRIEGQLDSMGDI